MLKKIFSYLIFLIFCFSFFPLQTIHSSDPWKEILTMKSSRRQTEDILSEIIHSRSKLLKIRYESELDPKFETGSFRIGCYRAYGDKSCYESIVPRTDCNYYVYEEAIIYGWELGYSDYQFDVKSEGMNWTITVFEYEDYEKEPYFVENDSLSLKTEGNCPDEIYCKSLNSESGILRIQFKADLLPLRECGSSIPTYSIYYSISSNPGFYYSIGYNKGYTIHFKKGEKITFYLMVKYCVGNVTINCFDPKFDF